MTTLITSNEEMDDIVKIIKSLEESFLLTKRVRKTIKIQRGAYLCMLLFTLDASLLGNLLTGKRTKRSTIRG